jgi:glyceraldehyde 3-phosphate dehydrogenase
MKRIAINGFGRIGRSALKVIFDGSDLEVVGVNDLMDIENAAYLLKYDSNYGKYEKSIRFDGDTIFVGEKATSIRVFAKLRVCPGSNLMLM